ncbi:T9SS type A sorting domain-containing protein [Lewinella sp. LCG006]|uniref:T9SS type A sorting domain-containing protein n=1 Tax=Lewinella sp. LCG006 TaxID=3231911 RepID=UPI0034609DDF
MKPLYLFLIFSIYILSPCYTQVVDSTFGEPNSFSPGQNVYGVTASDFSDRKDKAYSMLFLDDGKIIMAGHTAGEEESDFAFTRLLANGQYDQDFGPDGKIQLDLGLQRDSCLAAVRYGSDQMLMGGSAEQAGEAGFSALLIKTDFDGQLNSSFGTEGKVFLNLPGQHEMITRLHPLPDGKIMVAGNVFYGPSYPYPDSTSIFVGRLLENGSVDESFGNNGFIYKTRTGCPSSILGDLVVYPDGAFLLTAETYSPYPGILNPFGLCEPTIYVSRFLPDGAVDTAFGEAGTTDVTTTGGWAKALGIYEDGKIIVAGLTSDGLTMPNYTTIARLLPDGTLDSTFADQGVFREPLNQSGLFLLNPIDLIIQGDEMFVGFSSENHIGLKSFGVLCLNNEGQRSTNFGGDGVFTYHNIYGWGLCEVNQIQLSADQQSLYFTGGSKYQSDMFICKLNISDQTVATDAGLYNIQAAQLYPNPLTAGEVLHIELPGLSETSGDLLLQVYDSRGSLVMYQKTDAYALAAGLSLPVRSQGVYFVEVSNEEGRYVGKVLVQD